MTGMQLNGIAKVYRVNVQLPGEVLDMVHLVDAAIHHLVYMFIHRRNEICGDGCFPGLVFFRKNGHAVLYLT